jgi:hypothetical protein
MRPVASALIVALTFVLFAGCAPGNVSPPASGISPASVVPSWMQPVGVRVLPPQPFVYDAKPKAGIYAGEFYGPAVLGYRNPNRHNKAPVCDVGAEYVNGFSVDGAGNLVVPTGSPTEVKVYKGPGLCGKLIGSFADPYGQASDAASANASNGMIVVGNIEAGGSDKVGNIAVCTLAKGCTRELKSAHITYYGGGVALARDGDCWMASENDPSLSAATLTYFKHCSGSGQSVQGWKNAYYGGLIINKKGDLISVDFETPALWVYKGCNPTCHVEGGPFALEGESFYGNLNKKGDELALGDVQYGQVDVYRYSSKKLTYKYSFNKGLTPSLTIEAAGFSPTLSKVRRRHHHH